MNSFGGDDKDDDSSFINLIKNCSQIFCLELKYLDRFPYCTVDENKVISRVFQIHKLSESHRSYSKTQADAILQKVQQNCFYLVIFKPHGQDKQRG
jgi:hypothetical protein